MLRIWIIVFSYLTSTIITHILRKSSTLSLQTGTKIIFMIILACGIWERLMITSDEIKRRLWNGANELRGSMDASRYKDYMLALMFYKFLSDKTLKAYSIISGESGTGVELTKSYAEAVKATTKQDIALSENSVIKTVELNCGYPIFPNDLYQSWVMDINAGNFELEKVTNSLNTFERNISGIKNSDDFKGLFTGIDLSDTALGTTLKQRSDNIKALILLFADLNMIELQENDIIGDAYEYLIGEFAMESGKKAGEFYTPHYVSEVIAQIVALSSDITSVYDPAVGSGSLLLTVSGHLSEDKKLALHYYGQEKNTATYNLTRMNLLLHGVQPEKMDIKNGDTLTEDWPEDPSRPGRGVLFDAVVMNPPYSAKNWNRSGLKGTDPRFEYIGGILPPDNKGDYAFLLHGLYHLNVEGTMGIVLPHGVLFRGAAEGDIRQRLIEKNCIDAVIGLPAGMFTNTGIPVIIMILKKNRKFDAPVLIIDASKGYVKQGKQNVLRERDIAKIVDTYISKKEEFGYSHCASRKEIEKNGYNLNIPRYVESMEEEIPEDVDANLYGGIPEMNIKNMKVLQSFVSDIMAETFKTIRPGYFEMTTTPEILEDRVLTSVSIMNKKAELQNEAKLFVDKYWNILKNIQEKQSISISTMLKKQMLEEIKHILEKYSYIDIYSGYQVVADIWKNCLNHDLNIISDMGFYSAGRMRVPNLVVKGSGDKKHEEQDGWVGAIVPNELIEKNFYKDELTQIKQKAENISEAENTIAEFTEDAKNDETSILADCLNDAGETLDRTKIKKAISENNGDDAELLKKVEKAFAEKSKCTKELKDLQKNLKDAVQERISKLTNEEIDKLMYEKWFGVLTEELTELVTHSVQAELDTIKDLYERYKDTLDDIDIQLEELTAEFEELKKDLVVLNV